ncbi:MAG: helix-turn-helix domain-containing protein [Bacteroidota bacterium]
MNRSQFGALVSSLREDIRWTQAELAEKSEVPLGLIKEIEAGRVASLLADDTLIRLADGLRLTTLERREFLLAASGVTDLEIIRPEIDGRASSFDIRAFLQVMGEQIARVRLPVYVTDVFCDILLVNRCTLEFYQPPEGLLSQAAATIGGFNQIHYVFHRDSNFREMNADENWDRLAMLNVRHFRRRTLRFRSTSYYSALIRQFLNTRMYPYFERCWRRSAHEINDYYALDLGTVKPQNDNAYIETESVVAWTPYGELYLHQLLPLSEPTARRIQEIMANVGEGYQEFAQLPDPRKE